MNNQSVVYWEHGILIILQKLANQVICFIAIILCIQFLMIIVITSLLAATYQQLLTFPVIGYFPRSISYSKCLIYGIYQENLSHSK